MDRARLSLKLPDKGALAPSNVTDPLTYYYHPLVGWLYRARINMGLSLLEHPVDAILETGCASGLLASTLRSVANRYVGIDITLSADMPSAPRDGGMAFHEMDVSKMSFGGGSFDAVVAFSLFEHLPDLARSLEEIKRVLKPRGQLIAGFPQVSPFMNACFDFLGCPEARLNHINTPAKIIEAISAYFKIRTIRTMPSCLGYRTALYTCVKCEKAGAGY